MTVAVEANPTLARRRLAVYFRKLREQHGFGLDRLSTLLNVDLSQASRLDTGARGFRVEDIRTLSREYGLADAEQARLLALAEEARKRAWWQQYDLAPSVRTLIGMEQAAAVIDEYASYVIPGLLQTPDYARAVVAAAAFDMPQQKITEVVTARMRRQRVLERDRPPELWVVIDESVLARAGGGRAVMRSQLEHLHMRASEPNVTVQIIGFDYGLYPGGDHFIILEMGDGLPAVLYNDSIEKPDDTTDAAPLRTARRRWDRLRALAMSPRESAELMERYIDRFGS